MSACISTHGEYSDHVPDDTYTCTRCGVLDEEALTVEVKQLRAERDHFLALAKEDDLWKVAADEWVRQRDALTARLKVAERERDLAIAHDRQPYPTAEAYESACRALEKHRQRADAAEVERKTMTALLTVARQMWEKSEIQLKKAERVVKAARLLVECERLLAAQKSALGEYYATCDHQDDLKAEVDAYRAHEPEER